MSFRVKTRKNDYNIIEITSIQLCIPLRMIYKKQN